MTKILNGKDLADFIKNRQAKQVRALIQSEKIQPKLAILATSRAGFENLPIETYMRMKRKYGADIQIEVEIFRESASEMPAKIRELNADAKIHGIIVQLPLDFSDFDNFAEENSRENLFENSEKKSENFENAENIINSAKKSDKNSENPENFENISRKTDEIVNLVAPEKDVDALGENAALDPATPMAINWLLAGYNIDLRAKNVVIVGNGRLVGKPLAKMWRNSGLKVEVLDEKDFHNTSKFHEKLRDADVVISATGVANLIKNEDVKFGAVVVDAGTASEHGKIVGDVAPEVRARNDLTITPEKGGVGPLTIVALMDNVIRAAENSRGK